MFGHVACGAFRWKTTPYLPLVVTLARLLRRV
jgi:hypothetical protein